MRCLGRWIRDWSVVFDVLGTIGVVAIVGVYFALQMDWVDAQSLRYSLINAVGAALILLSLSQNFNWPAALVEFFWLIISLFGIWRALVTRQSYTSPAPLPPED